MKKEDKKLVSFLAISFAIYAVVLVLTVVFLQNFPVYVFVPVLAVSLVAFLGANIAHLVLHKKKYSKQILVATHSVRVREFVEEDVDALFKVLSDPETMAYEPSVLNERQTAKFIRDNAINAEPTSVAFAVENRKPDQLIGYVMYHKYAGNNDVYVLSWILDKNFREKGIEAEILTAIEDYSKKNGVRQLIVECDDENVFACRTLKKNGFRVEE